jgi:hypothetical protein
MQACPKRLPLWPIRFALRWLLPLPCLQLLQQQSLPRPNRPLWRLWWLRCSLRLLSLRWMRLLLQLPHWLRLQRWLARFHWLQWLLRWLHWRLLWRLQLYSSLWLPLPELLLVLPQLPSVARALQVCPKRLRLWPVRFALCSPLQQRCLPLQRLLSLMPPDRPLCRLS